jgi:hypothetical protein
MHRWDDHGGSVKPNPVAAALRLSGATVYVINTQCYHQQHHAIQLLLFVCFPFDSRQVVTAAILPNNTLCHKATAMWCHGLEAHPGTASLQH